LSSRFILTQITLHVGPTEYASNNRDTLSLTHTHTHKICDSRNTDRLNISPNNDLLSQNSDLVSPNNDLLSQNSDLVLQYYYLLSHDYDILSHNNDLLSHNYDLVSHYNDLLSHSQIFFLIGWRERASIHICVH
jgi:hypothetical protein